MDGTTMLFPLLAQTDRIPGYVGLPKPDMVPAPNVDFFQDLYGVFLFVLVDRSFLRWLVFKRKKAASPQLAISEALGVPIPLCTVKITGCVEREAGLLHHPLNGSYEVCGHSDLPLANSKQCIEDVLENRNGDNYLLASRDAKFYNKMRKDHHVGIITVKHGKIVCLPPTEFQKGLLRSLNAEREEIEKQQEDERTKDLSPRSKLAAWGISGFKGKPWFGSSHEEGDLDEEEEDWFKNYPLIGKKVKITKFKKKVTWFPFKAFWIFNKAGKAFSKLKRRS